jgi:hypothetical protein
MDSLHLYKSSDLIEEEENKKRYLELFIGQLRVSLDEIFKRVEEEANLSKRELSYINRFELP